MTLPASSSIHFRLVLVAVAVLFIAACNEQKSRPAEKMAAADAARKLEPVGGAPSAAESDNRTPASDGTARLADEDMVADARDATVAVSEARPETRHNPEPPAPSQKPAATPELSQSKPEPAPAPRQAKAATKGQKTYVVQRGDSLWKIAQKQYGDGRGWRKIYNANRARIADPGDVPIGTKLIIP